MVFVNFAKNKFNMKKILLFSIFLTGLFTVQAQKYFTKTGHIWFHSEAPLETIEAHNYQSTGILDSKTGEMVFKVMMTGFQFEKALMQQHFNEKYVESDKFPESTFKGKITNFENIDFSENGTYATQVEGQLTIHGVTQPVKTAGTVEVKSGKILAKSTFQVAVEDYKIKIPAGVKDNIAKILDIHVDITYEPMAR